MKKFGLSAVVGTFLAFGGIALADPPKNFSGWDLVFEDNFDGNSLDLKKWNPTYNWGHTHNHRAYCDAANVIVSNGTLKLKGEAKKHPDAPATAKFDGKEIPVDYTSGAIDTRGHFEVKYGYIEGRFKAPWQKGTWPAFWTLQDGWPPEIDILEIPASRKQHHYYLHYTNPSWYNEHGSAWDHEASFGGHKDDDVDRSADFHTYAVEWDETNLNFYFDDKRFASYSRPTEIKQLAAQYIIVNLAIGGWAGNDIEVTADKPAYFEADWIRVWKAKPAKPDTVLIQSEAFGKCMQVNADKKLVLDDCKNAAATAIMTPVSSTTFRVDFGGVTLEIPNENKDPGVIAGVYEWNGKDHQKVVFENQSGNQYRLKMLHSGHYLRATEDGASVVQDWSTAWEWHQKWRVLKPSDLKAEEPKEDPKDDPSETPKDSVETPADSSKVPADSALGIARRYDLQEHFAPYGSKVFRKNGMLYVEFGPQGSDSKRRFNLKGRQVK
ncbi:MAG: family 16 glycosylhydrolase [Fibrobacter sp.]|nr:family 16 glycosylhydrolase [Fibrobacter sp.]